MGDADSGADFDIELVWPSDAAEQTPRAAQARQEAEPAAPEPGQPFAVLPSLQTAMDRTHAAVVALTARLAEIDLDLSNLRSAVVERLRDQGELMTGVMESHARTADEHRKATDRAIGELRADLGSHADAVASLSTALEDIAARTRAVHDDLTAFAEGQSEPADDSSAREAVTGIVPDLTASIDDVGGRIAKRVELLSAVVTDSLDDVHETLESLRGGLGSIESLRGDLAAMRREPAAAAPVVVETPGDLDEALADIREQIVLLKRRLSVRAKASVVLDDDEVRRIAAAVVEQIGSSFEVVQEAVDAEPAPALEPSPAARRRPR
jgi:hypothetical protein